MMSMPLAALQLLVASLACEVEAADNSDITQSTNLGDINGCSGENAANVKVHGIAIMTLFRGSPLRSKGMFSNVEGSSTEIKGSLSTFESNGQNNDIIKL